MSRATKSGINLDTQRKLEANYDPNAEQEARDWLEAITGETIEGDFFDALKDGSYLCRALNILKPSTVPKKYEKVTKMPFTQMEAVGKFIEGCKNYGMGEKDLFVTLDLYEKQNKNMVVSTIHALGRQAQKNGFEGPVLGPKEAEANPREFSEEQLKQGQAVIGLQMGTNQVASQAGMVPYGLGRQVYGTTLPQKDQQ